jgi:hypothetical protein
MANNNNDDLVSKRYTEPDQWEYDGGSKEWTGEKEKLPPYIQAIQDKIAKDAFGEKKDGE